MQGHMDQHSKVHMRGVEYWNDLKNFSQKLSHSLWTARKEPYSEAAFRQLCHDPDTLSEEPNAVQIFEAELQDQIRKGWRTEQIPTPPPGISPGAAVASSAAAASVQDRTGGGGGVDTVDAVTLQQCVEQLAPIIGVQNTTIAQQEGRIHALEQRLWGVEAQLQQLQISTHSAGQRWT